MSNLKILKKIEEQIDQLTIDKARIDSYKELVEKNISETKFEIGKIENNLRELHENEIEMVIELDKQNYEIEVKQR